ncbi:hypothetical protein AB0F59_26200 [Micromonospora lupini]|uniref:hypothetical protein n=1 Tax=Micromonospora lupini TaxID=285679 RepID=UPI0033F474F9
MTTDIDWRGLIDGVLLDGLLAYAKNSGDKVDTVYLTGSYTRGTWNQHRPNVNVYFIAGVGHASAVRAELASVFADIRDAVRAAGVDFTVDCHPYTIGQRDAEWLDKPLLTLTTKVFAIEHSTSRYHISPTIGYGWYATHVVLHGRPDALDVFSAPPPRDDTWFHGAHAAVSHYRNLLDHLPWALDPRRYPDRLVEESCRYAEEAIRDGVHFGSTDAEIADASNVEVLHRWAAEGRQFYLERYGPHGANAVDTVARLKQESLRSGHTPEESLKLWQDALDVWAVVWSGFVRLSEARGARTELSRVIAWL